MNTREQLLNQAEFLLRERGYAAFSYADLAAAIGIRKASIHHHFRTKEELGVTLVEAHLEELTARLAEIQQKQPNLSAQLMTFAAMLDDKSADRTLPLCASLAAEVTVLPERLQTLTTRFFDMQLQWLQSLISAAIERGECSLPPGEVAAAAEHLLALVEGVALIARATGRPCALNAQVLNRLLGVNS